MTIDLPKILRQRRAELKISQTRAASLCKISQPAFASYEEGRGTPCLTNLLKLARGLGYDSLDEFLRIGKLLERSKIENKYHSLPAKEKAIVDLVMGN